MTTPHTHPGALSAAREIQQRLLTADHVFKHEVYGVASVIPDHELVDIISRHIPAPVEPQWHNPENVPADKVPKGWRFLTVGEAKVSRSDEGLRFLAHKNVFEFEPPITRESADNFLRPNWTYLIPDTSPTPTPAPAPAPDVDALVKALEGANETIEEMDRIHHDLMDNGPSCTCGDGDEWCVRCARSIKLSDRASSAIKKLDAALQAATDARPASGGEGQP